MRLAAMITEVDGRQADVILAAGYDVIWAGMTGGKPSSPNYFRKTQKCLTRKRSSHVKARRPHHTHDCNAVGVMARRACSTSLSLLSRDPCSATCRRH